MPKQFTCERCGIQFSLPSKRGNRPRRFCSRACYFPLRPIQYLDDKTAQIPLYGGKFATIDAEDAEWAGKFNWAISKKGYVFRKRIVSEGLGKIGVMLAREIMQAPPDMQVDHIDRDKLNNRRGNLRLATQSQNLGNTHLRQNNTTGFKGVYKRPYGRWSARVSHNNTNIELGSFATPVEAALAYDQAAKEYFGEFAWLNLPDAHPSGR